MLDLKNNMDSDIFLLKKLLGKKQQNYFQTKIYDHIKKSSYTEYQMNDESYLSDFKEYIDYNSNNNLYSNTYNLLLNTINIDNQTVKYSNKYAN